MPLRMLKDGQKRLTYRKPNTGSLKQEYEYFNVLKETKNHYYIEVKDYHKKVGQYEFVLNGVTRISKSSGRELRPNSEENPTIVHANGRYYNENGTHYEAE